MGLSRLSSTEGENAFSIEYTSWLMEHPSALDKLEQMMSIAKGRKIVIFLDYDGTLSDIVPNPEEAFMTDKMRTVLREVANRFPTAIISGRRREKVQDFVQLNNVYYAGSHGLDIEAPLNQTTNFDDMDNEVVVLHQPAKEFLPEKHKVLNLLSERTKGIKGVNIEDNKFCISVHYRHVHAKDLGTLENVISTVLKEYQNFRLSKGKKVFEIRPNIGWNKGHALEYFLENLGFGSSDDVLPIYIGDDRTDEDAFNVLRKMGQGLPIVVSATPKDTKALYSLREPKDVMEFLLGLVQR
ncbi:probable trehalose-phosphate phosphatase 6 [Nicotiana tomentosiformis]|uniref:Trehalose 6-phosphate phosphatase n=1 Tax=Nicotiana tabacum TaxID=4097 RepID=A0A1S4CYS0_TOBAC|nr:probable trehalose-phosphate phosphatase 6 isoform X1 [Nicotiana tomentosiformis]XP_016506287.1 PREDICTED: probable trehalose-phosphate phosphatase 6 [Nicotiana tabacum]